MTTKQRSMLRALANALEPTMQIGKEGAGKNSVVQVEQMLEARELIKIKVLNNCDDDLKLLANELAKATNAEVVQVVGRIITLYRKPRNKKANIELPN